MAEQTMKTLKDGLRLLVPCLLILGWASWVSVGVAEGNKTWQHVRFDGIYSGQLEPMANTDYFRFYPDRTVVFLASDADPKYLVGKLDENHIVYPPGVHAGVVQVRGKAMWVSLPSWLSYTATVTPKGLELDWHDADGFPAHEMLTFTKVPAHASSS